METPLPTQSQTPVVSLTPPKKTGKFYFGCLGLLVLGMVFLLGLVFIFIATASPAENPLARALNIEPARLIDVLITAINIFFGFSAVATLILSMIGIFRIVNTKKEDPLRKQAFTMTISAITVFTFTLFAWAGIYIFLNTQKENVGLVTTKPAVVTEPDDTLGLSAPITVNFDASNAPIDYRKFEVLNYAWNFGDGTSGTGQKISHEYKDKGTTDGKFEVVLTIKKLDRQTFEEKPETYKLIVTISNVRPTVELNADALKGVAPHTVNFTVSASDPDGAVTSYAWDLDGDGEFDDSFELATVQHTYEKTGKFQVGVKVTDTTSEFTIVQKTVEIVTPITPQAVIDVAMEDDGVMLVNKAYLFSGEKSLSPSGKIVKYEWNFGDGAKESSRTASHAYAKEGTYLVTLSVTDEKGEKGTSSTTVKVLASPASPKAVINVTPAATKGTVTGTVPFSVIFDASKSTDPDKDIVEYNWDFENDGKTDVSGVSANHTYTTAGTYTARLTVTDAHDHTDASTVQIKVEAQGILAKISALPSSGSVPLTVTFDASGSSYSGGEIVSYEWEFGDGSPKRLDDAQVSHKYEKVGTFTAKVTAIGKDNMRASATTVVIVKPVAVKACIEASKTSGPAPLLVVLTSCSTGSVTKYKWDLDADGSFDDAVGPQVTHTFPTKGTYPVSLEVTDNENVTDTFSMAITAE